MGKKKGKEIEKRNRKLKESEEGSTSGLEKVELSFEKLFSRLVGIEERNDEIRILMMGPDTAGKTMILDKLKRGEMTATISDCNVETVEYKNISFSMWDVWGEDKTHYLHRTHGLIFVVDCNDRGSFVKAKDELHLMMNKVELSDAVLLVFANNPALPNAKNTNEIAGRLELLFLQQGWKIQNTYASSRDGDVLYEGLDWFSNNIASKVRDYRQKLKKALAIFKNPKWAPEPTSQLKAICAKRQGSNVSAPTEIKGSEERNRELKESEERNRELKESEEINRKLKESEEGGTSGHIQNTSASSRDGDGLYEGLDWLSNNIASKDFSEVRIDSDHMEYLWAPATFIRE